MKRKKEDERVQLEKRKKRNVEDEEVYKDILRKKSFKKLKDELSEKASDSFIDFSTITKEEVVEKLALEFNSFIKLPQDVKFNIFDYLTLVITEEDMTKMESHEKNIKEGTKPNLKDINYVKHFYGYYRNMDSPFIVFKNLIFDFKMMNHLKINQIFTNIIPFTNSSMNQNELKMIKISRFKDQIYIQDQIKVFNLIQKYVKDQFLRFNYFFDNERTLHTENITKLVVDINILTQQYKNLTYYSSSSNILKETFHLIKDSPINTISISGFSNLDLILHFKDLQTLEFIAGSNEIKEKDILKQFNSLKVKNIKMVCNFPEFYSYVTPSTVNLFLSFIDQKIEFKNLPWENLETITIYFRDSKIKKNAKESNLKQFKKIHEMFPKLKFYSNMSLTKKDQMEYPFIEYLDSIEY